MLRALSTSGALGLRLRPLPRPSRLLPGGFLLPQKDPGGGFLAKAGFSSKPRMTLEDFEKLKGQELVDFLKQKGLKLDDDDFKKLTDAVLEKLQPAASTSAPSLVSSDNRQVDQVTDQLKLDVMKIDQVVNGSNKDKTLRSFSNDALVAFLKSHESLKDKDEAILHSAVQFFLNDPTKKDAPPSAFPYVVSEIIAKEEASVAKEIAKYGQDLLTKGLPPLHNGGARRSSSVTESKLAEVKIFRETLELASNLPSKIRSKVWNLVEGPSSPLIYTSETDVQAYTKTLLGDILREPLLAEKFSAVKHAALSTEFHLPTKERRKVERPDIMVVCDKYHRPVGAIEVKTPLVHTTLSTTVNDEATALLQHLPQLFEYLFTLYFGVGVLNPFGILTNNRVWFFCWLSPARIAAAQSQIPTFTKWNEVEVQEPQGIPQAGDWGKDRLIHVDGPHKWDNPHTVKLITSILLKMLSSPIGSPQLQGNNEKCFLPLLELEFIKCVKVQLPILQEGLPNAHAKKFYLLRILGQGAEGQTWKACTEAGNVCALKIFSPPPTEERIRDELTIWEKVWEMKCFVIDYRSPPAKEQAVGKEELMFSVTQLPQYCHLVMPLLNVHPTGENLTGEDKEAVVRSIEKLAMAGYEHQDLRWPNVGFRAGKAILFDLRVKMFDSNDKGAVERAIQEMKGKLGL